MAILTDNLKQLSGKSLRQKIAKWTDSKFHGVLWGGVLVSIAQNAGAAAFILIGMVRAGIMTVQKSIPVIIGANLFSGLIVFILVIDVKTFVLLILGIAGLMYTSNRAYKFKNISGTVLGMTILFLGLSIMQQGVAPLSSQEWFQDTIAFSHGSYLLAFLIGAVLRLLIQSSLAVIVFAIAFERAGLLSIYEVIMILYGSNVGGSVLIHLLTSSLTGSAKQLAMYQIFYSYVGAILVLPLFYVEVYMDVPLLQAFAASISADGGKQIALVNLFFNVLPSFVLYFFVPTSTRFLQKYWPETTEETISKPKYIQGDMTKDPTGSLELIQLEQNRLLDIASSSFNTIREGAQALQRKAFHEAFTSLSLSINETIKELTSKANLSSSEYSRLNLILNNQHLLENVNISLETLGTELSSIKENDKGVQFSNTVVEGLDTILLTLMDVAKDRDDFDIDFLEKMTSSEGNGIAKIRSAYLDEERDFDITGKMLLLSATNLTERLIHDFGEIGNNYKKIEAVH